MVGLALLLVALTAGLGAPALQNLGIDSALVFAVTAAGAAAGFTYELREWIKQWRADRALAMNRQQTWQAAVTGALAQYPPPRMLDADPYRLLGVFPSTLARLEQKDGERPPYVAREIDEKLRAALAAAPMVLVKGPPAAGKRQSLYEALCAVYPQRQVLVPAAAGSLGLTLLTELAALDPPPALEGPPLLWLEEVDRWPAAELARTAVALRARWPTLLIAATRSDEVYDAVARPKVPKLQPIGARDELRALLHTQGGVGIELTGELRPGELEEARRLYPHLAAEPLLERLGEYFVGTDTLIDRYLRGRAGAPAGAALVEALLDVRRTGIARGVKRGRAAKLAAPYLTELRADLCLDEDLRWELAWAAQPVASQAALLREEPLDSGRYRVAEFLVSRLTAIVDRPVADHAWQYAIERLLPAEGLFVGAAAYAVGREHVARQAWQRVIDGDDPSAPVAWINLGVAAENVGDHATAKRAWRRVVEAPLDASGPEITLRISHFLRRRGYLDQAEQAYRQIIAAEDPDVSPHAANDLGVLLRELGRVHEAEEMYRRAIVGNHPEDSPRASRNLGILLEESGRVQEAEQAWRQAVSANHPDATPKAAHDLGVLFKKLGRVQEAEHAWRQALAAGHSEASPKAAYNLGVLFHQLGRVQEAEAAYRQAVTAEHPEVSPHAANKLGVLLEAMRRWPEAESLHRQAIAAQHPDASPLAANDLGALLKGLGREQEAEASYRQAIAAKHFNATPTAAYNLGLLLEGLGRKEEAEQAWQLAMSYTDETGDLSALRLAQMLRRLGYLSRVEEVYKEVATSKRLRYASIGAAELGKLLERRGAHAAATAAFDQAIRLCRQQEQDTSDVHSSPDARPEPSSAFRDAQEGLRRLQHHPHSATGAR